MEEAEEAVRDCFAGDFGEAGSVVVIEEMLEGPECSMLAFLSEGKALAMPCAQDHKRAFDGDLGPNTGGMGVYSPVPCVTPELEAAMQEIMQNAAAATAKGIRRRLHGRALRWFHANRRRPQTARVQRTLRRP